MSLEFLAEMMWRHYLLSLWFIELRFGIRVVEVLILQDNIPISLFIKTKFSSEGLSSADLLATLKLMQIPGCWLAGILGVLIDVPIITIIVIYKAPIMLVKGWQRLLQDLIGRAGPFLETVCVPFAGLAILLWPVVVVFATVAGIISSFFVGCYAAVVAYQESSTRRGLLYIISAISMLDEYTNDFLYMREGSCFPRPRYRKNVSPSLAQIPLRRLSAKDELVHLEHPPIKTTSMKMQQLTAVVVRSYNFPYTYFQSIMVINSYDQIWDNFFKACEYIGKELIGVGAIWSSDLEAWQYSKNKIVNIGLPAYVFLQCFLRSIKEWLFRLSHARQYRTYECK